MVDNTLVKVCGSVAEVMRRGSHTVDEFSLSPAKVLFYFV